MEAALWYAASVDRFVEDAYQRIVALEDKIGSNYYAGQQEAVDNALKSLDELSRMIAEDFPSNATGTEVPPFDETGSVPEELDPPASSGYNGGSQTPPTADAADAVYNGTHRFADVELKPADLMGELAESGVKYSADDVVMVTKNSDGKLLWLETGNDSAGLKHLWQRHESQFTPVGYTQDDIPALIKSVTSSEPVQRGIKEAGPYAVYYYQDIYYLLAYGDNGFIVSFYPCG